MGEVVSLNQFRKKRERDLKSRRSAENKARSGRKKGEREAFQTEAQRREAEIVGKRLEEAPDEPKGA